MGMIGSNQTLKEGEVLNKWMSNRLKHNKNVILAITGPTGSGKSYTNLRLAELWYKDYFDEDFPVEKNTCFSISELMKLLNSDKIKKGTLIILEEAGTSLNSLDFQNKVCKLFSFILQSFRSMNIILIFNLPVLTMLNKSARVLLHGHFITQKIDYSKQVCKIKPLFHQLNQERGKSYWKYLRIKHFGKTKAVKRINYSIPSENVIKVYEQKKFKFVHKLSKDFSKELEQIDRDEIHKLSRNDLTNVEQEIFDYLENGLSVKEIRDRRQCSLQTVYDALTRIKKKGFTLPEIENY